MPNNSKVAVALLLITAAVAFGIWSRSEQRPEHMTSLSATQSAPPPSRQPPIEQHARQPIEEAPPAESATATVPDSFDVRFAALVEALKPPMEKPPVDDAGRMIAQSRMESIQTIIVEILTAYPDAGVRAFGRLAQLDAPWQDDLTQRRAHAAGLLIDFALQTGANPDPTKVSGLVSMLLDSMALSAEMTRTAHRALVGKPYLNRDHEPTLLTLAGQATGELAFLHTPVRELLLTLWKNVSSADDDQMLRHLLACFSDNLGGATADAAAHRLLLDPRYRSLVVNELCRLQDAARIRDAAQFVVENLPFDDSISILGTLQSSGVPTKLIGAYSWLSVENAAGLKAEYERCLGEGNQPNHREMLVMSAGNAPNDAGRVAGLECAKIALDNDPSPIVRGIAFLAICNNGEHRYAQEKFAAASSAPDFAQRYRVSYLVSGVVALARQDGRDLNFLDQASALLLQHAKGQDRARLLEMRANYLPK